MLSSLFLALEVTLYVSANVLVAFALYHGGARAISYSSDPHGALGNGAFFSSATEAGQAASLLVGVVFAVVFINALFRRVSLLTQAWQVIFFPFTAALAFLKPERAAEGPFAELPAYTPIVLPADGSTSASGRAGSKGKNAGLSQRVKQQAAAPPDVRPPSPSKSQPSPKRAPGNAAARANKGKL